MTYTVIRYTQWRGYTFAFENRTKRKLMRFYQRENGHEILQLVYLKIETVGFVSGKFVSFF